MTQTTTHQHLATGFPIGMRFHSETVVRLADAKPGHLGHTIKADGRWRIFAFGGSGDPGDPASSLAALCDRLEHAPESPVVRFTRPGLDIDEIIDVRAVCQQSHRDLAIETMPSLVTPRKGRYGLIDYEKVFCPDQYVAHVLPLDDHDGLAAFFAGFMLADA